MDLILDCPICLVFGVKHFAFCNGGQDPPQDYLSTGGSVALLRVLLAIG
jgi:hypothetical protein